MSWIPFITILVMILGVIKYSTVSDQENLLVIYLYCFGALFEVLGEPFYNLYNSSYQLQPRARAESFAITIKCITTYIFVAVLNYGVMGFGIAQVCYGLTYLVTMIYHYNTTDSTLSLRDFLPTSVTSFSREYALCALSMTGTSCLKHLLTEVTHIY